MDKVDETPQMLLSRYLDPQKKASHGSAAAVELPMIKMKEQRTERIWGSERLQLEIKQSLVH